MKILPISTIVFFLGCTEKEKSKFNQEFKDNGYSIYCNDEGCRGKYVGKSYVKLKGLKGDDTYDIAHQFSNKMCTVVGNELKDLFLIQKYSKVDLKNITMSVKGQRTRIVTYELFIPFKRVQGQYAATSFDHRGGWNENRHTKQSVEEAFTKPYYTNLEISTFQKSSELTEMWIQWMDKSWLKKQKIPKPLLKKCLSLK